MRYPVVMSASANQFIDAKKQEWSEYIAQVHDWELHRYLGTF